MKFLSKYSTEQVFWIATVKLVVLIAIGVYGYIYFTDRVATLEAENAKLSANLVAEQDKSQYLTDKNAEQQYVIDSFSGQIADLGGTLGDLEKLANTDEELLRKYSKVYFLSENYIPTSLTDIDEDYVYNGSNNHQIHTQVWPFLRRMLQDAQSGGVEFLVASAYRSFNTQASLKSGYTFTYGSGANTFSADQGYSEHQLGTSVDLTTEEAGALFVQRNSDAFEWLKSNAHRYGFVLSYPEGNAYYKFEPWHWRFVGVELATFMYEEDKYFYNLTQRQIDAYLIRLFD